MNPRPPSSRPSLQCANPACGKALSSATGNQVFEFEVVSISVAASDDAPHAPWDESPKREARRIYLCPECAKIVSIRVGPDGITIFQTDHS